MEQPVLHQKILEKVFSSHWNFQVTCLNTNCNILVIEWEKYDFQKSQVQKLVEKSRICQTKETVISLQWSSRNFQPNILNLRAVTLQRKVVGRACSIIVVHIKNIILHRSCTRKYISTAAQRIKQRMTHINFRGSIKHKCIYRLAKTVLFSPFYDHDYAFSPSISGFFSISIKYVLKENKHFARQTVA